MRISNLTLGKQESSCQDKPMKSTCSSLLQHRKKELNSGNHLMTLLVKRMTIQNVGGDYNVKYQKLASVSSKLS
jgi:hypothetical protein